MRNKKGFTLIELLAVIIILGILMIIAIPAVTSYIQDTKKSAFVDSAVAFMDDIRNKVNSQAKIDASDATVLYLIPAGNDETKSCVKLESGGESPLASSWSYAYVGVTYNSDHSGYNYFFVGKDSSGNGLEFKSYKDVRANGADDLFSSEHTALGYESVLTDAYAGESTFANNSTHKSGDNTWTDKLALLATAAKPAGAQTTPYTSVEIIAAPGCTNK